MDQLKSYLIWNGWDTIMSLEGNQTSTRSRLQAWNQMMNGLKLKLMRNGLKISIFSGSQGTEKKEIRPLESESLKESIDILIIRIRNTVKTSIYFTNLSSESFTTDDVMEIYSRRWDIEVSYKTMKTSLGS